LFSKAGFPPFVGLGFTKKRRRRRRRRRRCFM
jgi:hypothetical protein